MTDLTNAINIYRGKIKDCEQAIQSLDPLNSAIYLSRKAELDDQLAGFTAGLQALLDIQLEETKRLEIESKEAKEQAVLDRKRQLEKSIEMELISRA